MRGTGDCGNSFIVGRLLKSAKQNIIVIGLVFVAFVLLGIYLPGMLDKIEDGEQPIEMVSVDKDCNVTRESCRAEVDGKVVHFMIHGPIYYLQHFDYELSLNGFEPNAITRATVEFDMLDMQMGLNRYIPQASEDGQTWRGVAVLPVCVSGRKDWRVTLVLETDTGNYRARFDFVVGP